MGKRTTQTVVEVGYAGTPKALTTQTVVEVGYVGTPLLRATQVVVEVAYVDSGAAPSVGFVYTYAQIIG